MSLLDLSIIATSFAIAGGFYAYLLVERRKLRRPANSANSAE